ncbi:MAG: putative oxidoreductase [Thermoleophilaceae bacterium]|jgi:putative oxidoreductase|nr:putative oxidoreductase [Thermoleophilaceae bacterium]MEA2405322.1 putative oxidoreductase [Thermoleophilaceae bacterium]
MEEGLLILRVVVGVLFVGHGAQKLFGIWGGHGIDGTAGFFEGIGLRPGRLHATAAGFNELAGGALLAVGLFTPLAAVLLIATMTAAIVTVHGPKGAWASNGGYEYNLVLVAVAFAVTAVGSGTLSLDNALGLDDRGIGWALGALALGLIGGLGAVAWGRMGRRAAGRGTEVPAPS